MKIKKIVICLGACALMALASSCGSKSESKVDTSEAEKVELKEDAQAVAVQAPGSVVALDNDDLFRPGKAVSLPTVLDFNATWCIPCKKLTPAFEKAAADYTDKVAFYSVDIDKNPDTKEAFGVENVPTVVIIQPDGSYKKYVGLGDFATEAQLTDKSLSGDGLTQIIYDNLTKLIQ